MIEIYGNTTPSSLEALFKRVTGMSVKVCYTDASEKRIYISSSDSYYKKTLPELNELFKSKGYYYNDWK